MWKKTEIPIVTAAISLNRQGCFYTATWLTPARSCVNSPWNTLYKIRVAVGLCNKIKFANYSQNTHLEIAPLLTVVISASGLRGTAAILLTIAETISRIRTMASATDFMATCPTRVAPRTGCWTNNSLESKDYTELLAIYQRTSGQPVVT
jgi:hypothetical protein